MTQKYLVTPALPYANGAIHLGHLVEHVQVNVFVRALRMAGEDVLYVCGSDCHGTPIELNAAKAGKTPEVFVEEWQCSHEKSLATFGVEFDGGFGTTHTPENEKHAGLIFEAAKSEDHIFVKEVEQLFDPEAGRFLSDRMVKGICPKCKSEDQYGDQCEACGTTYNPTDLIEAKSAVSGATPVLKKSNHYFFKLSDYQERLEAWTRKEGAVQKDVQHYLNRWFEDGLREWDISRDGPYFGFKIPGEDDKYFYVWLDAPIGYIALAERAAKATGRSWEDYWKDENTRIFHFIGKDIVYFHTLFWPALLMSAGYTLPETVAVHGFLTVDGQKMSKSRGTFIMADTYAEHLTPEAFRYYVACKLNSRVEDVDLNLEDFAQRVNADLINKVVNLISRTVPMLHRNFEGVPGEMDPAADAMLEEVREIASQVEGKYRDRNFSHVVRDVVAIADKANRYLQDAAPWKGVKEDPALAQKQLCTALYVGKVCVALLKPIIPEVAAKTEAIFHLSGEGFTFANLLDPIESGPAVAQYPRLFERVDPKKVVAMVDASRQDLGEPKTTLEKKTKKPDPKAKKTVAKSESDDGMINFDQFMEIDLRAAKVIEATDVEGADKLLCVQLDVGSLGKRQVFAGLKPHVSAADLNGKTVVMVANLKPRKMRFGMSEGMILAAGDDVPTPVFAEGAQPGDRVR